VSIVPTQAFVTPLGIQAISVQCCVSSNDNPHATPAMGEQRQEWRLGRRETLLHVWSATKAQKSVIGARAFYVGGMADGRNKPSETRVKQMRRVGWRHSTRVNRR
jgi:hypothetical protein